MKKRIFALFVAALLIATLLPVQAAADNIASGQCGGNVFWSLDSTGLLRISGTGAVQDYGIIITDIDLDKHLQESTWNGFPPWMDYQEQVKSLIIEGGITSIGQEAFQGMEYLESVSFSTGLKSIGVRAFRGCLALKSVSFPAGLKSLGEESFSNCQKLTEVIMPAGLTELGAGVFSLCPMLETVTLPGDLTQIPTDMFYTDTALKHIDIPAGVTIIGPRAFQATGLESINLSDGLTMLGDYAFRSTQLTEIELPDSLFSIGNYCFSACWNLERIEIPDQVTSLIWTFHGCMNLREVKLPSQIKWMFGAFNECESLESIELPEGLESIDNMCFEYCGLREIVFPSTLQKISAEAFARDYHLEKITFLGNAPGDIVENAFSQVTATVYYPDNDPSWTEDVRQNYGGTLTWESFDPVTQMITAQPVSVTVNEGAAATFRVTARGSNLNYQWYYRTSSSGAWQPLSGQTAASASIIAKASRNGWQLRVKVSNEKGEVYSDAATLTVKTPVTAPTITAQPTSVTVNDGSAATFKVTASGGNLSYQWYYRTSSSGAWQPLSGQTKASASIGGKANRNGWQLRVKVSNEKGEVYSNAVTLTVKVPVTAPTITAQPTSVTVNDGSAATFKVTATGGDLSYQWYYRTSSSGEWQALSGQTKATASIGGKISRNGWQLRVKVSNEKGAVYSNAVTLTVKVPVTAPAITAQPTSVTVNEGTNATFKVTATGGNLSYQWYYRTSSSGEWQPLSGQTKATASIGGKASRSGWQLRVRVFNEKGEVYSNAVTLTVKLPVTAPAITAQPTSVTASNGSAATFKVTATGGNLSYQWYYRTSSSDSWKPLDGQTKATASIGAKASRNGWQLRVRVSNEMGALYSSVVTLTVQ